ncbi:MAG: hypothetical protein KC486_33195, partial [Myxococcales bacterium]|nr:hypothetical protein [Myxococcales bacterium]
MEARRTWLGIFGAGALACAGSGRPTASATGGATETTVAGTSSSESAGDLTTTGAGTSTSTGTAASTGAGTTAGESTRGTDPSSTGETEETTAGAPLDGEFPGMVSVDGDDGVDRCAVDPAGDLERQLIADPDYILAYSSGLSACGVWAPSAHGDEMRHRQGIVRLHRAAANYLVVSMSVEPGFAPGIEVVRL